MVLVCVWVSGMMEVGLVNDWVRGFWGCRRLEVMGRWGGVICLGCQRRGWWVVLHRQEVREQVERGEALLYRWAS